MLTKIGAPFIGARKWSQVVEALTQRQCPQRTAGKTNSEASVQMVEGQSLFE